MDKIRIAQVGVTHEHASGKMISLKNLPEIFEVAGVVNDLNSTVTPCYVRALNSCFNDLKELTVDDIFNDPSIKAVAIEVPNNELVPVAMKFAERGIAMHLDKPAGLDLELYGKLLQICKDKKVPFQMGYMFRGNPAFQFCIRAIREKLIGELITIQVDMNHGYGGEWYQEYIGKFTGGIMYNLGCHLIDFIAAAMGRPENVTGFLRSAPGDPAEIKNNSLAVLEYPNAFAVINACSRQSSSVNGRMMRIVGTKGTICFQPLERFDRISIEIDLELTESNSLFPAGHHTLKFPPQTDRYTGQLIELAQMIRGEKVSSYSFEHDYLVHEITLAAAGYREWKK